MILPLFHFLAAAIELAGRDVTCVGDVALGVLALFAHVDDDRVFAIDQHRRLDRRELALVATVADEVGHEPGARDGGQGGPVPVLLQEFHGRSCSGWGGGDQCSPGSTPQKTSRMSTINCRVRSSQTL